MWWGDLVRQAELQQVASNAVKVGEGSLRHTIKEMDQPSIIVQSNNKTVFCRFLVKKSY